MEIERKRAFIIRVVYFGLMAALAALAVKYAMPLLGPFVLAAAIAYLLRSPTKFLMRKTGLPTKPVAMAVVLLFYSTVGLLIVLLSIRLYALVRALFAYAPHLYSEHLEPALTDIFVRFENFVYRTDTNLFALIQGFDDDFMSWLGGSISSLSGRVVGMASSLAAAIPGMFIELVLMIVATFFIAADYDILRGFLLRQMSPKGAKLFFQIKTYVVGTLFVCIYSYFIIATMTFVELSIAFSVLGLKHPILIAAAIAVFDIMPVVGTGGILGPWSLICLFQGKFSLALGLLVTYVVITAVRNTVEPKIVGGQLGLHPVVTLSSMFAGGQLFGAIGLFGFPILLSLLRYLNENGSIHIFKNENE